LPQTEAERPLSADDAGERLGPGDAVVLLPLLRPLLLGVLALGACALGAEKHVGHEEEWRVASFWVAFVVPLVDWLLVGRRRRYSLHDVINAQVTRRELAIAWNLFFDKYDLLLSPSVAVQPFEVGKNLPEGPEGKANALWSPYTSQFNLSRHPAASVPCGRSREKSGSCSVPSGMKYTRPCSANGTVPTVPNPPPWAAAGARRPSPARGRPGQCVCYASSGFRVEGPAGKLRNGRDIRGGRQNDSPPGGPQDFCFLHPLPGVPRPVMIHVSMDHEHMQVNACV
jgi:hypothetical protein